MAMEQFEPSTLGPVDTPDEAKERRIWQETCDEVGLIEAANRKYFNKSIHTMERDALYDQKKEIEGLKTTRTLMARLIYEARLNRTNSGTEGIKRVNPGAGITSRVQNCIEDVNHLLISMRRLTENVNNSFRDGASNDAYELHMRPLFLAQVATAEALTELSSIVLEHCIYSGTNQQDHTSRHRINVAIVLYHCYYIHSDVAAHH